MDGFHDSNDGNFAGRKAALICNENARKQNLKHMAARVNCTVTDGLWIMEGQNKSRETPDFDLALIDLASDMEISEQHLLNISGYLSSSGVEALIWTDLDGLDVAYATLPIGQCHFLVGDSLLDAMLIMSGASTRGKTMARLHDKGRDDRFSALHKMSDELADFARTLARLAEDGHDMSLFGTGSGLAEKPSSFRTAPADALQPLVRPSSARKSGSRLPVGGPYIREIIKMRRRRDAFFPADLFADPAWDILLDLLAARLEGQNVSVSSLCIAAAVPATTALRWITSMTESGILVRHQDPKDARRIFMDLSDDSFERLIEYFTEVRNNGPI